MKRALAAVSAIFVIGTLSTALSATPKCQGLKVTKVGTSGDDVIRGTKRIDVIVGLGGNDRLLGMDMADVLCGGPGTTCSKVAAVSII